jgi:alanine dehydrogenase
MVIGTPLETRQHEHRVGLTPFGVAQLTQAGHTVLVQKDAGRAARFSDHDFERSGAQIVYDAEEIYGRADLVCRMGMLGSEDVALLKPGSVVCAFHHLAVAPRSHVEKLMDLGTTLIGYEVIHDGAGDLPVLIPMSEIAGQMAVHVAAHLLENDSGGRGILIGSVAGVPPPTVLVLGAGTVGRTAACRALANGAHVIVADADLRKLRRINREFQGRVVTIVAAMDRLERYTAMADVLIGAVLIPGARAPFVVTEAMVRAMKPGSVIVDVSIDQGGCVETSRPTTLASPTFVVHDVVHYCVPNMTANIARTASRALAAAAIPYVISLTEKSVSSALREDPGLAEGVYLYRGRMVNRSVGQALGLPVSELSDLLAAGERS